MAATSINSIAVLQAATGNKDQTLFGAVSQVELVSQKERGAVAKETVGLWLEQTSEKLGALHAILPNNKKF